jgi:hypothetical protein
MSEETVDWHAHPYMRRYAGLPRSVVQGVNGAGVAHVANATAAFIAGSMFLPAEDAGDMHQAVMQVPACFHPLSYIVLQLPLLAHSVQSALAVLMSKTLHFLASFLFFCDLKVRIQCLDALYMQRYLYSGNLLGSSIAGEATMVALEKERDRREGGAGAVAAGGAGTLGLQRRTRWGSPVAAAAGGVQDGGRPWLRDAAMAGSAEREAAVGWDAHKLGRSISEMASAGRQLEMEEKLFTVLFMEAQQVAPITWSLLGVCVFFGHMQRHPASEGFLTWLY